MPNIKEKWRLLIDMIEFHEDVFQCHAKITSKNADSIDLGVFKDAVRELKKNDMFIDNNLLEDAHPHLETSLATSVESLCKLSGKVLLKSALSCM